MMPNWTESQRKAIETQNRSLLVSAGAGSGKTTVLTERILRRLIAGGDVSRLLVVTFTKAAASDMKEKLYAPSPRIRRIAICAASSTACRARASAPSIRSAMS